MEKITYTEFLRKIDGKNLALLHAGFYQNFMQAEKIKEHFISDNMEKIVPINSGVVTVRSKDFFRTLADGKQSYASKIVNTVYYTHNDYLLLLSPVNFIFYKVLP